jgi:hypothetical protein
MPGQTIHHGVHPNLKYISAVCCVSADGKSMTPFMVSSQVIDPVMEKLKFWGNCMGLDFILEHRQKPYMTAGLSQHDVTTVLIRVINEMRKNDAFAGKPTILVMDDSSIDRTPASLMTLREHNLKLINFPPHTTQIFQASISVYLMSQTRKINPSSPWAMTI